MEFLDPESSQGSLPSNIAMQIENACKGESDEPKATEYAPASKFEKLKTGRLS